MFDVSCERDLLRTIFKPERSLDVSGQAQLAELQQKLGVAHLEALHISRIGGGQAQPIPTWIEKININP